MNIFKKMFGGLAKTASNITQSIAQVFTGKIDEEFYDDMTAVLLGADIGMEATEQIIDDLRQTAKKQCIKTEQALKEALAKSISHILDDNEGAPLSITPEVLLIVGVNGVGKTTAIGKLAAYYKAQKKNVLVVAADTFRAAATEQLDEWASRAGVRIVKQSQGADPASVVFDGLTSAKSKNDDIVIIDTAGRLHNKSNLMDELKKIDRVVLRHEIQLYKKYIVLDATTGQNALNQVEVFNDAVNLDGVILTKLDGTAKGGVVVAIKQKFNLPVCFIGVGEKLDDLLPFDVQSFAKALVGLE